MRLGMEWKSLTLAAASNTHVGPDRDEHQDIDGDDDAKDNKKGLFGLNEVPQACFPLLVVNQVLQRKKNEQPDN